MKEWRNEYDRVSSMLKTDGLKFEEALRQQEDEYENEIDTMDVGKRKQAQTDHDRYNAALRDTVSVKNSAASLRETVKEQQKDIELHQDKAGELKQKLEEALNMFADLKEQLKERDKVLLCWWLRWSAVVAQPLDRTGGWCRPGSYRRMVPSWIVVVRSPCFVPGSYRRMVPSSCMIQEQYGVAPPFAVLFGQRFVSHDSGGDLPFFFDPAFFENGGRFSCSELR